MAKKADLSPAEFEVMDALWRKGHATVKEIQAELGSERKMAYTTIATLLGRMKDKGYVDAVEKNFAYEYHPLVERDQVVRRKVNELVKRVLGGDISPLAAYIVENRKLTPEQIRTLEEIIRSDKESK